MITDSISKLKEYYSIDEKLKDINRSKAESVPVYYGYVVDKDHTNIFFVNKGSGLFATGWRENPLSRDVLAAITAKEGSFVLYLPGEPMLVKEEIESEISRYVLK